MSKDDEDIQRYGRYRRVFESYIFGRRINQLSWAAEAFYWRIYVGVADDYGNFPADPLMLIPKAGGLRRMTGEETTGFVREMESKGLIRLYLVDDIDWFGHILSFVKLQPPSGTPRPPHSGRRRQYPESPWDSDISTHPQFDVQPNRALRALQSDKKATKEKEKESAKEKDKETYIRTLLNKNTLNAHMRASGPEPQKIGGLEEKDFIFQVFEYWQKVCRHPNAHLSPERVRLLQIRWKDSSLADIRLAIDGCASSDFHMGRQPNNPDKYDDILLICRNRAKVEWFMDKVQTRKKPVEDKKKKQEEAKKRWSKE